MQTAQFILGLKEDLWFPMEMQLLESIAKAVILPSIQEKLSESQKGVIRSLGYKCICLSCGVQVAGAVWWAATRIVAGVRDLM
jgi:hypothetical protein